MGAEREALVRHYHPNLARPSTLEELFGWAAEYVTYSAVMAEAGGRLKIRRAVENTENVLYEDLVKQWAESKSRVQLFLKVVHDVLAGRADKPPERRQTKPQK